MPNIIQRPDPPTIVEAEKRITGRSEVWAELLNAPGTFNACDVWFQVDGEEELQDSLRLFAQNGPIKVPLWGPKQIQQASSIWKDQGGSRWSGILFSVRSRPCDGFKLEIAPAAITSPRARSQWRMSCWWDCGGPYSDNAGAIMVDPWRLNGDPQSNQVQRYRSPPGGMPAGPTVLVGPPGEGARWDLMWAALSTSYVNPVQWTLQGRSFDPPFVTNILNGDLDTMGGPWVYQGSTWPGPINSQWELSITLPGGPGEFHIATEWRRNNAYT
jgi:hypothetical protein